MQFCCLQYLVRGKYDDAVSDFDTAIEKESGNGMLFLLRGMALAAIAKLDEACLDFHKADELGIAKARAKIEQICK